MTRREASSRWIFAVETWVRGQGGAGKAIRSLAETLAARGEGLRVVSWGGPSDGAEGWPGPRRLAGGLARFSGRRPDEKLAAFFPVEGADLYYPHGGAWTSWERQNRASARGAYRLFQGLRMRLSSKQRAAAAGERRLLSGDAAPDVVAISRWVADDFARDYGMPRDRLHLVYNGVDTDAFRPDPALREAERRRRGWADAFVCLFAAHNFRLKGLANAVACAGKLAATRGIRWAVVGKGKAAPYRAMAWRLGCADRIDFLGPVSDLRPFYAAADLLVQPTFYDPCSLTTLEALACGLPVLTSRWNGAAEILQGDGGGAVMDDPRDAGAWAEAVRRRADAGARDRSAARASAERHTEEAWASRVADVLAKVSARIDARGKVA